MPSLAFPNSITYHVTELELSRIQVQLAGAPVAPTPPVVPPPVSNVTPPIAVVPGPLTDVTPPPPTP